MAGTKESLESVNDAERRARRRLPKSVYSALIAGAERGDSSADNLRAFRELGFIPRIATGLPLQRDLATTSWRGAVDAGARVSGWRPGRAP